jgi:hypothetical protein
MAETQYKSIILNGFLDLNKNELRQAVLQNLGSDIGTPVNGLIFYRGDSHRARLRMNGVWQDVAVLTDLAAAGIPPTLVDVKGDLIVATAADIVDRLAAGANGTVLVAASGQATGLQWRLLTTADITGVTTDTLVGRDTAATGAAELIAVGGGIEFTGSGGIQRSALTGDVTATAGSGATVIGANKVVNTMLAQMAQATFKMRAAAAGTGDPIDGTAAQAKTALAIVPGDVTGFDTQVRTSTLNQMAAPTADLSINNRKLTSVLDGTAVTDAVTLGQLNAAIEGRQWKDPVTTATTGVLPNTPTYNAGAGTLTASSNTTLAAQAGHTLLLNERILVKDQASNFQDGLYQISALGSGAAPWVLTRTADASTAAELSNATVMVEASDSTLKGKIYTQQNTLADLTAAAQSYTVTGDNNVYTADESTLTLSAGQFAAKALGITNAHISASAAIAYSKLNLGASIVNADIAAGAAIAYSKLNLALGIVNADISATAAIAGSKLDRASTTARASLISNGTLTGGATSEVITHNLNTQKLAAITLIDPATKQSAPVEWTATSVNTATLNSPVNLPAWDWVATG